MFPFLVLALTGCDYGFTLPSGDPAHEGPVTPGLRTKVRERRPLLPGFDSSLPPPEPGIYAEQCSDLTDGGSVSGPGCITGTIRCGDTLVGHTIGGVQRFDSRFYEKQFCTPRITNHDGGDERVYTLEMPEGDWTAYVTLDSPCVDLDVAAFKWDGDDCPTTSHILDQCEMFPNASTNRERLRLVTQHETRWFVVVEGKNEYEGAFSLTVQCRPGLI